MEIRIRQTGAVVTESEFRALHPSTSFPPTLTASLLNDFGADPVLEGAQASGGEFWQFSMRDGVEQIGGQWFTKYVLGPMFATEAEKNAYIAQKASERAIALQAAIVAATQERLDAFARTRNYDGILSACTYATSPTPKFAAEGQYCVASRDATWAKLYQILGEVEAGTRPAPSGFADIEGDLPALTWPA